MSLGFPGTWRLVVVGALGLLAMARPAQAEPGVSDAGPQLTADGGNASVADADPRAAEIQALIAGTLPVTISPGSLFEVPLDDEQAVQVDAVRLRALLRVVDEVGDAGAVRPARNVAASPVSSARVEIAALDPARFRAREALDRARLAFYSLPSSKRAALLAAQAERVESAKPKETEEERRAREADEERQRALAAAHSARSEAERLVGEELARLLAVEHSVVVVQKTFADVKADLAARRDSLLGWQRRVSDAKATSSSAADETYDALRRTLRGSRDDLDRALNELESSTSKVPALGRDPVGDLSLYVSTEHLHERRAELQKLILHTRDEERSLREQQASTLLGEIDALNRGRLALLSYLSPDKQAAITGFTLAGFDQASSEARQLLLILRYHRHVAEGWLTAFREHRGLVGVPAWRVAAVAVPWALLVLVFVWLRRRTPRWLVLAEQRVAVADRREQRTAPSALRSGLLFVSGFHKTLEWLLLYAFTFWLLPAPAQGLLELQLLEVIVGWTLGGALIVNVINAIAAASESTQTRASDVVARLRLRSLRLVGRVVVAFVLVLLVSARLVGEGTVYRWVWSTCWLAAVPVFLILVRWWRNVVFERVGRGRRKSELQSWVLANQRGWKSFFAAMVGAVHLFSVGAYKVVRSWITGFNLARRAHAYLFKRELDRLAIDQPAVESSELSRAAFESLAPDRASISWVDCAAAEQLAKLVGATSLHCGGVVALVGDKGSGKTALLRRVEAQVGRSVSIDCGGERALSEVRRASEQATERADAVSASCILLDNAQRLAKPIRGGLRPFDEALSLARQHAAGTLWVFAFDAVVWPFLSRARDARPMFDEVIKIKPWSDEQIGELLSVRSVEAEISPTFEDLLERLPVSADEIDRREALSARRAGYFRMVWDYSRGNPAMALEVWRASLRQDGSGTVRVRSLLTPNAIELDVLPDSALFILRAILQMAPATVSELVKATCLGDAQVENAVRYGRSRGYLVEEAGKVSVAWGWLRSVLVLLERRHLLVSQ